VASQAKLLTIHYDSQGAIALSKDNKFHVWTKHIDIQHHFVHEAIEDGKLSVVYRPTDDNPVDIFTKPLAKVKFCCFVELLGCTRSKQKPNIDVVIYFATA
jgi:hypothetical protein